MPLPVVATDATGAHRLSRASTRAHTRSLERQKVSAPRPITRAYAKSLERQETREKSVPVSSAVSVLAKRTDENQEVSAPAAATIVNTSPPGAANGGASSPQAVDSTLLAQQLLIVQQLQAQLLANGRGASMGRCKLPEFWEASPESWFIHAESLFANYEVQDDVKRYNLVIEALKPAIMQQLLNIARNPPGTDRYATLKAKMLERFALSQEQRLRALFKGIDARGKKP